MKTMLFCTSYITEDNYKRYEKWIDYYYCKLDQFNSTNLFLVDDGSPNILFDKRIDIIKPDTLPNLLKNTVNLIHFDDRLGRSSIVNYRGWWRSFTFSLKLAEYYNMDKIIHIESDFYVVSRRMIDYIANLSFGWTSFYSRYYDFPETAIQIICKDSFEKFNEISRNAIKQDFQFNQFAELILPFTKVEKKFYGDRFGEEQVLRGWLEKIRIPFKIDYLGQIGNDNLSDFESYFNYG